MSGIVVYRARKIITMDPNRPETTHVAVRDGRVLATGDVHCAEGWGEATVDDRYADKIIMPGLVEAHAHVMAGGVWEHCYIGQYDRTAPDGTVWKGLTGRREIVARMRKAAEGLGGDRPLVAWGVDPNVLPGDRLSRGDLDEVTDSRPVVAFHSNFHVMTANSFALDDCGYKNGTNVEGVVLDDRGTPTGELQEFVAMARPMEKYRVSFPHLCQTETALRNYGSIARNAGTTTVADLFSVLDDQEVAMVTRVTGDEAFPARYHPVMDALRGTGAEMASRAHELARRSTPKLKMGAAKLFTDGAIQAFTAKVKPPGYFKGKDQGIWNMPVDEFRQSVRELHGAGVQIHIHTNGDAASELGLDAIEEALRSSPWADHRHTLEHVQLADMAQFRRARALGVCVNLFANHIHYFGDVHYAMTVGPDRAERMNAFRDALDAGVPMAFHSDAPITPLGPLFSAWIACNRITMGGRTLGERQCLTVPEALYAITLGAAYILKMDDVIGSIQAGKYADFCVLDDDPLARPKEDLKDIGIHATVLGGVPTA